MTRPLLEELLTEASEAEREALEQGAALVLLAVCADLDATMPSELQRKLGASARQLLPAGESD